jgi:hypothetical protein
VDAYVFEAELVEYPDVSRRLAVRGDQTLADLHQELRRAFEWWDDDEYRSGSTAVFSSNACGSGLGKRSPTFLIPATSGPSVCVSRRSARPETRASP